MNATEKEYIEKHLTMIENKRWFNGEKNIKVDDKTVVFSPLRVLIRDTRSISWRNEDGKIIDKSKERFRLWIWWYMIILDHIWWTYELKENKFRKKTIKEIEKEKKNKMSDFQKALYWFTDLSLEDIKILYKYRCALIHKYNLSSDNNYHFQLFRNTNWQIVRKESKWMYIIDPIWFCNLIENIYQNMIKYFKEDKIQLNLKKKEELKTKGKKKFFEENFLIYIK